MLVFNRMKGFSLIELLVVIVILALSSAMVGPSLIRQYEKMTATQELATLDNQLRFISQKSFYSKSDILVTFSEHNLAVSDGNSSLVREFKSITFQQENVTYNRDGSPTQDTLSLSINGKDYDIELPTIYKTEGHDSN